MNDLLERALKAIPRTPENAVLIADMEEAVACVQTDHVIPAIYYPGSVVRHNKGNFYRIVLSPQEGLRMEENAQRAYAYTSANHADRSIWVREQRVMEEEGKFELVSLGLSAWQWRHFPK